MSDEIKVWSHWSACSRSCDGGVTVRRCFTSAGDVCGEIKTSCNNVPCIYGKDVWNLIFIALTFVPLVIVLSILTHRLIKGCLKASSYSDKYISNNQGQTDSRESIKSTTSAKQRQTESPPTKESFLSKFRISVADKDYDDGDDDDDAVVRYDKLVGASAHMGAQEEGSSGHNDEKKERERHSLKSPLASSGTADQSPQEGEGGTPTKPTPSGSHSKDGPSLSNLPAYYKRDYTRPPVDRGADCRDVSTAGNPASVKTNASARFTAYNAKSDHLSSRKTGRSGKLKRRSDARGEFTMAVENVSRDSLTKGSSLSDGPDSDVKGEQKRADEPGAKTGATELDKIGDCLCHILRELKAAVDEIKNLVDKRKPEDDAGEEEEDRARHRSDDSLVKYRPKSRKFLETDFQSRVSPENKKGHRKRKNISTSDSHERQPGESKLCLKWKRSAAACESSTPDERPKRLRNHFGEDSDLRKKLFSSFDDRIDQCHSTQLIRPRRPFKPNKESSKEPPLNIEKDSCSPAHRSCTSTLNENYTPPASQIYPFSPVQSIATFPCQNYTTSPCQKCTTSPIQNCATLPCQNYRTSPYRNYVSNAISSDQHPTCLDSNIPVCPKKHCPSKRIFITNSESSCITDVEIDVVMDPMNPYHHNANSFSMCEYESPNGYPESFHEYRSPPCYIDYSMAVSNNSNRAPLDINLSSRSKMNEFARRRRHLSARSRRAERNHRRVFGPPVGVARGEPARRFKSWSSRERSRPRISEAFGVPTFGRRSGRRNFQKLIKTADSLGSDLCSCRNNNAISGPTNDDNDSVEDGSGMKTAVESFDRLDPRDVKVDKPGEELTKKFSEYKSRLFSDGRSSPTDGCLRSTNINGDDKMATSFCLGQGDVLIPRLDLSFLDEEQEEKQDITRDSSAPPSENNDFDKMASADGNAARVENKTLPVPCARSFKTSHCQPIVYSSKFGNRCLLVKDANTAGNSNNNTSLVADENLTTCGTKFQSRFSVLPSPRSAGASVRAGFDDPGGDLPGSTGNFDPGQKDDPVKTEPRMDAMEEEVGDGRGHRATGRESEARSAAFRYHLGLSGHHKSFDRFHALVDSFKERRAPISSSSGDRHFVVNVGDDYHSSKSSRRCDAEEKGDGRFATYVSPSTESKCFHQGDRKATTRLHKDKAFDLTAAKMYVRQIFDKYS